MIDVPSLLYSDTEDDLRSAVRDLLRDHSSWSETLRRTGEVPTGDSELWPQLAHGLGLAGLPVPESLGGADATWSEVAVVLEELGGSVSDVPFLTSAVLATALAMEIGANDLISELASGVVVAAVAVPLGRPFSMLGTEVTHEGSAVSGRIPLVAGALEANVLLVPVGGTVLQVSAADVIRDEAVSLDMTRRLADLTFDRVEARELAGGERVPPAMVRTASVGAALLASEQLGLAERALDMTIEYVRERRQFGRTIGSYQAVKHRLADLWTDVTKARAVARYAAACAARMSDDLHVAASLAQALCSQVSVRVAEECVQLHGGIGFTWEHPAHLYLKRARADALALGTPAYHRSHLGGLVDLPRPVPSQSDPLTFSRSD